MAAAAVEARNPADAVVPVAPQVTNETTQKVDKVGSKFPYFQAATVVSVLAGVGVVTMLLLCSVVNPTIDAIWIAFLIAGVGFLVISACSAYIAGKHAPRASV